MKKLGFIVLAIVLALGSTGVGYALWSQDLTITGNVGVAQFDVHLANIGDGSAVAPTTIVVNPKGTTSFTVTLTKLVPNSVETVTFDVVNDSDIAVSVSNVITNNPLALTVSDNIGSTIAAKTTVSGRTLTITTPNWLNSVNQGGSEVFTYTITAAQ